jgi:hypothetical protein
MDPLDYDIAVAAALDSLLDSRLAILAGAGLSMAAPTNLPSAATLAAAAKIQYDATYGATRAPLPPGVEDQAEFFFRNSQLATVYFGRLIDLNAFAGPPNPGHYAIADLLLVKALQSAVTTNVDTLIETAGNCIFGTIGAAIDGTSATALLAGSSPLLKIHGCLARDPPNMVWAPGQLTAPPVAERIRTSAAWLNVNLLNRDLLIVGYWTDWDYLNAVLEATLGRVNPSRVIVVDPADPAGFARKAPQLFAIGQRASTGFQHVRASGSDFLDSLRKAFSRTYIRRVLHSGHGDYHEQTGTPPAAAWLEPPEHDNQILWKIRRDLEGRIPNEPALDREPPPGETLVGLTMLQLQAAGAVPDGPYWLIGGHRVRIVRALNRPLHRVQADYEREDAPTLAPDIGIAVGAEAQSLPKSIARATTRPTIARGTTTEWYSRLDGLRELGL